MAHIQEQLKALQNNDRLNPDRVWVERQRETLLGQIGATTQRASSESKSVFVRVRRALGATYATLMPQQMLAAARPIMTLLLVAGLAVGGWSATVSASYNSIPGDRLYQVKLATENVQKAMATMVSSDAETVKSDIDRAKRRAEEIRLAVERTREDPSRRVRTNKAITEVAVRELEESVQAAEEKLQQIAAQNEAVAADVAQEVSEQTEFIKDTLREAAKSDSSKGESQKEESEDGQETDTNADSDRDDDTEEQTIHAIVEASKRVSDIGINALTTAVETRSEGDDEALLKEVMQKKIVQLTSDAEETVSLAEELSASTSTVEMAETATGTASAEGDGGTEENATSTISAEDVDALAEELTRVNTLAEEATALVEAGTFSEAIETVRTLYDTVSAMQETVRTLRKSVSEAVVDEASEDTTILEPVITDETATGTSTGTATGTTEGSVDPPEEDRTDADLVDEASS